MNERRDPANLTDLFQTAVATYPNHPLFGTKNSAGEYEWITYAAVAKRVDGFRSGLAGLGVTAGDTVGIIAGNRTEWAVAAMAVFGLGACYVPMYEKELPSLWKFIIDDSAMKVLLVSTPQIRTQIEGLRGESPTLERVLTIDATGPDSMAELEAAGLGHPVAAGHPASADTAVLIYTSGTTGKPKGVRLSHGNITSNSCAGARLFSQIDDSSRSLSILPWAHAYGQVAELYTFIHGGASIGFMEDVTTLGADMAAVRPTFLIAVPRVFNKIYEGLWKKMDETGGLAKRLFVMGVDSARQKRILAEKGRSNAWVDLKIKIADAVVFKKIRQRFGDRLLGALTASAMMNLEVLHFFSDIGIPVYDCYGMTETSPAVTMNCPAACKPGTVGRPIENVRIVIDSSAVEPGAIDGEVIVYGPNVMQGYHNRPDATRAVMTADGGFVTGDRGWIDPDGYLHISGRIKEQYKLENGKYVFPAALEEEIQLAPYVENVMIHGDGRAFNVCLVVPDFEAVGAYAAAHGLPNDPRALVGLPEIHDLIARSITGFLLGKFGKYEIPKKFILLSEPFSLENGTLTQTMKLKRRVVLNQFESEIEALYTRT